MAFVFLFITVYVGFLLTLKKSTKRKLLTWGILTMCAFSPGISWFVGMVVSIVVGDGFAGVAIMMIVFPFLLIVGFILLLVGIFQK